MNDWQEFVVELVGKIVPIASPLIGAWVGFRFARSGKLIAEVSEYKQEYANPSGMGVNYDPVPNSKAKVAHLSFKVIIFNNYQTAQAIHNFKTIFATDSEPVCIDSRIYVRQEKATVDNYSIPSKAFLVGYIQVDIELNKLNDTKNIKFGFDIAGMRWGKRKLQLSKRLPIPPIKD